MDRIGICDSHPYIRFGAIHVTKVNGQSLYLDIRVVGVFAGVSSAAANTPTIRGVYGCLGFHLGHTLTLSIFTNI